MVQFRVEERVLKFESCRDFHFVKFIPTSSRYWTIINRAFQTVVLNTFVCPTVCLFLRVILKMQLFCFQQLIEVVVWCWNLSNARPHVAKPVKTLQLEVLSPHDLIVVKVKTKRKTFFDTNVREKVIWKLQVWKLFVICKLCNTLFELEKNYKNLLRR